MWKLWLKLNIAKILTLEVKYESTFFNILIMYITGVADNLLELNSEKVNVFQDLLPTKNKIYLNAKWRYTAYYLDYCTLLYSVFWYPVTFILIL
jgi:hypothetical protein